MKVKVLLVQVSLLVMVASVVISAPYFSASFLTVPSDTDHGSQMTTKVVAILEGDVLAQLRQVKGMINPMSTTHLVDNKAREAIAVRMRENLCKSINPRFSIEDSTGEAVFGTTT